MSKLKQIDQIVDKIKEKEKLLQQAEDSLKAVIEDRCTLSFNGSTFVVKDIVRVGGGYYCAQVVKGFETIQKELINLQKAKINFLKSEIEGLYFKLKKV